MLEKASNVNMFNQGRRSKRPLLVGYLSLDDTAAPLHFFFNAAKSFSTTTMTLGSIIDMFFAEKTEETFRLFIECTSRLVVSAITGVLPAKLS